MVSNDACNDKISYTAVITRPTGETYAGLTYTAADRKLTLVNNLKDVKRMGYHTIAVTAIGEDLRPLLLTGGGAATGTGSLLMVDAECRSTGITTVTKPDDVTLYYTLGTTGGGSVNFNRWTTDAGCPTDWWKSAMTAVDDALTPNGGSALLTYNEVDREVTIAEIANADANGDSKGGKYERTIKATTRTGGTALNADSDAKLTVWIYDPDCGASTTMAFTPAEADQVRDSTN